MCGGKREREREREHDDYFEKDRTSLKRCGYMSGKLTNLCVTVVAIVGQGRLQRI